MNKDNPDTFVMDDASEWQATQVDDVFLPSVQVQLGWKDVEAAVAQGAIVPAQAHALWASWAAPGSPLRRGAGSVERVFESTQADGPWVEDMPKTTSSGSMGLMQVLGLVVAALLGAVGAWLALG